MTDYASLRNFMAEQGVEWTPVEARRNIKDLVKIIDMVTPEFVEEVSVIEDDLEIIDLIKHINTKKINGDFDGMLMAYDDWQPGDDENDEDD